MTRLNRSGLAVQNAPIRQSTPARFACSQLGCQRVGGRRGWRVALAAVGMAVWMAVVLAASVEMEDMVPRMALVPEVWGPRMMRGRAG